MMTTIREPQADELYRRVLQRGDQKLAQVWFEPAVLDKYRGSATFSVIRTNTIGRLSRPRFWQMDFGITPDDTAIHASLGDLLEKLPEEERGHWAHHVVTPPVSANFLQTQLVPASCIDDGDVRKW